MTEFEACSVTHPKIRWDSDYNNILDHGLEKGYSYIIRKNGSTYEAINGSTGKIFSSSTSAKTNLLAVIAALPSGGTIKYGAGTFEFDITGNPNPLINVTSKIQIIGSGIDVTIFKQIGTMPDLGGSLFILGAETMLRDLTLDGNKDNLTWLVAYTPASWFGGVALGNYLDGVTDNPATDAVVQNVKFINWEAKVGVTNINGLGLNTLYGSGVKVRDVSFYDCYAGQYITYQPTSGPNADTELADQWYDIDGVYAESCYIGVYWEIGSANLKNVRVLDSTVGILVVATAGCESYGNIVNPTLLNCTGGGIVMNGAPEWLNIDHPHIDGTANDKWGIRYIGQAGATFTLTSPTILNTGTGVSITDGGTLVWVNGKVKTSNGSGVSVTNTNITINGVEISGSGVHGVYIAHGGADTYSAVLGGNIISGNTQSGVRIDAGSHITIVGNRVTGNDVGIHEISTSNYNTFSNNDAVGNLHATVDIAYVGANDKVAYNLGRYTQQGAA